MNIMTPKEKAKQLIEKYEGELVVRTTYGTPTGCALIFVNEVINDTNASSPFEIERLNFWNEVKTEIEKL